MEVDRTPVKCWPVTDDLDGRLLAAIERVAQARRAFVQELATRHNLSPLQLDLLRLLARSPAGARTLAAELDVAASTVADALAALRRKQKVAEAADPTDGRRKILRLTADGELILDLLRSERDTVQRLVEHLDTSDKAAALAVLLDLIAGLHRAGILGMDRSCKTCQHRIRRLGRDYCTVLRRDLTDELLRVDCPEHASAQDAAR